MQSNDLMYLFSLFRLYPTMHITTGLPVESLLAGLHWAFGLVGRTRSEHYDQIYREVMRKYDLDPELAMGPTTMLQRKGYTLHATTKMRLAIEAEKCQLGSYILPEKLISYLLMNTLFESPQSPEIVPTDSNAAMAFVYRHLQKQPIVYSGAKTKLALHTMIIGLEMGLSLFGVTYTNRYIHIYRDLMQEFELNSVDDDVITQIMSKYDQSEKINDTILHFYTRLAENEAYYIPPQLHELPSMHKFKLD